MDPLSLATRRIIAFSFFAIFALVLVVTLVYASGWRIDGFSLEKTGGVHIGVPISDAHVSVNGKEVGVSGFLTKSFFVDNLRPGNYSVRVEADGYYPWTKNLIVDQTLVTDSSAFLVPQNTSLLRIIATSSAVVATTTRAVSLEDYARLVEFFTATSTNPFMALSQEEGTLPNQPAVELVLRGGNVFVRWNRNLERAPSPFCVTPRACVVEVSVELDEPEAVHAELFKDGVVYQLKGVGIFFSEIDVKSPLVVAEIFNAPDEDLDFRIYQGELYIKNDNNLSVVSGL